MEWKLLTKTDYVTTSWSGGTTTQLAISPEGAVYANRDFLWRLSSATVELEHSDFTPLPGYHRFLAVLEGKIRLKIDANEPFELAPGRVAEFDGGVPVESWGQCVDFNLMVRKGKGLGAVAVLLGPRAGRSGCLLRVRQGPLSGMGVGGRSRPAAAVPGRPGRGGQVGV